MRFGVLFLAGLWAGAQNALAGGGSFVTLAVLLFTGLDARAANITSTVALFPGQATTGYLGRALVGGVGALSFRGLVVISLAGGAVGAALLLETPSAFFEAMLPFLVLFATGVFAWGSFGRQTGAASEDAAAHLGPVRTAAAQFAISIYGGYFGGGIGFLMLAALTIAGVPVRRAAALKNVLAGVMNASAVAIFAVSPEVEWLDAATLGAGAIAGGWLGTLLLRRAPQRLLRLAVVAIGTALTVALFVK